MKKEILIKSVITIDEKGYDWFYNSNYCSQFETVKDLYYHFYELIREHKIKTISKVRVCFHFIGPNLVTF